MGYVPQFTSFHRDFPISVEETVLMGRLSGKIPMFHKYTKEDIDITHTLMEKLEIYHLRNRQIGQLSGGQFQRALIARPYHQAQDTPGRRAYCQPDNEAKSYIYLYCGTKPGHDHHGYPRQGSHIHPCGILACLNRELFYHGRSGTIRRSYKCHPWLSRYHSPWDNSP